MIWMQVIQFFLGFDKHLAINYLRHDDYIKSAVIIQIAMTYQAIEGIESHLQEELLEAYELFDNRGRGTALIILGYIDANGLIDNMKELGYEIDKRQVTQMIEFLDETGKGIITKDAFLKFMTARLVA